MPLRESFRRRFAKEVEPFVHHAGVSAAYVLIILVSGVAHALLDRLFPTPPVLLALTEQGLQATMALVVWLGLVHTGVVLTARVAAAAIRLKRRVIHDWHV